MSHSPLRSVHTSNLPSVMEQLGISLMVTTYQAGKLVILRSEGETINTHFRLFEKPMGMAVQPNRFAIGTSMQVWEFHNIPSVSEKLNHPPEEPNPAQPRPDGSQLPVPTAPPFVPPPRNHDACFVPRIAHWTGDIQIHEMGWVHDDQNQDELIFVNTSFSCLCRRSDTYNFEPVWRPSFITNYIPGDCCHLNGLGIRDGKARYVTALGQCDTPGGWRENKRDGGVIIDVPSGEIITQGLSMPHSPRWYRDRLWVLQSGHGGFGTIDPDTGKYESVVELPGFTRGLSFAGPLAFIGLSQVRESAVFGGIPIAERQLEERSCGVWVVNIETGEVLGFVMFEDAVQEIFAVEVLPGAVFPEVVNERRDILAGTFELPESVLDDVPTELRA